MMNTAPSPRPSPDSVRADGREVEQLLQASLLQQKPWPGATLALPDGRQLFVREARLDEVPQLLDYAKKLGELDHELYAVTGARIHAEILGWYRKRIKDTYILLGLIEGAWVGFASGRLMGEKVSVSLHTLTLGHGADCGAALYYAMMYYGFETLENEESWATAGSFNNWRRTGLGSLPPSYSWPDVQHELGGGRVFYITRKYWNVLVRASLRRAAGSELNFAVADEVRKVNQSLRLLDEPAG